jgi:hypothetical protein
VHVGASVKVIAKWKRSMMAGFTREDIDSESEEATTSPEL